MLIQSPSPRLLSWFKIYEECHKALGNKLCHNIGIPLIVVLFFGLFSGISLAVGTGFYLWLDVKSGMLFFIVTFFATLVLVYRPDGAISTESK